MSAAPAPLDEPGLYLYGVVAAGAALDVEQVEQGRLAAVVRPVSTGEFDEAALADAAFLERKIRDHEQLLERVLAQTAVLPFRFGAIYRDEPELRRFLAEHEAALSEALARVGGKVELGVKAFIDRERFASTAGARDERIRELAERVSGREGGRAYLEGRQLEQLVAEEARSFGKEVAAELHERLLAAADEGVRLAPQSPELSGRDDEMVLNGAYLVADRERFERELATVAGGQRENGVELELTGPWPPYNFVPEELEA